MLGLIVALSLGLVSLALVARLAQRDDVPGATGMPVTLLLYNLWVAGFLATRFLFGPATLEATPRLTPLLGASQMALLALSLAWLSALIAQMHAYLGRQPTHASRRAVRLAFMILGVALAGSWGFSQWTGSPLFHYAGGATSLAVFPTALVASVWFLIGARRLEDAQWRTRLSKLAVAYVALFSCLFALWIGWTWVAALSSGLAIALDVVLELLYNVIAIVWVLGLHSWRVQIPAIQTSPLVAPGADRARLLTDSGVTRREAEIVDLICLGRTNQEIADQLFIALTTVKDHNYVIFQKLGVRNRTELARLILSRPDTRPK